jgi:hypothetical protein
MTSDPASTTDSHEPAIPILEWQPNGSMYRIVLPRMSVSHSDVAEVQAVCFKHFQRPSVCNRIIFDLVNRKIDDFSTKDVGLRENVYRASIGSGKESR